jgi:hypothetical protein
MTRPPSYQEADALALFLQSEADSHAASARAFEQMGAATKHAIAHARLRATGLKRAAELMRWLADHSDRLAELERPKQFIRR